VISLRVNRPGLFTTVQDLGRWGWQSAGVPVSGAMDVRSHRLANWLAGNPGAAATLESTLAGPSLEVRGNGWIAAAGAQCTITVDGVACEAPCAAPVREGSIIDVGPCRRGARVYVAVHGGINTPLVLGSRATDARSGLGGIEGRALAAGDDIPVRTPRTAYERREPPVPSALPHAREITILRVLPGPHAAEGFDRLCAAPWTLTPRCDRVGCRFAASADAPHATAGLISIPTVTGSVQLTPSGEAILLMADRQTVGGYAQVAIVIAADVPVAAQLTPACRVRFAACSHAEAHEAWDADARTFSAWDQEIQ
jgi:antagonist of KipI